MLGEERIETTFYMKCFPFKRNAQFAELWVIFQDLFCTESHWKKVAEIPFLGFSAQISEKDLVRFGQFLNTEKQPVEYDKCKYYNYCIIILLQLPPAIVMSTATANDMNTLIKIIEREIIVILVVWVFLEDLSTCQAHVKHMAWTTSHVITTSSRVPF